MGIIDKDSLYARFEGDGDLIQEIVDIFFSELDPLLQRLGEALESGDAKQVELVAHSLKGSASNLAASRVYEATRRLEQLAAQRQMAECAGAYAAVLTELEELKPALRELVREALSAGGAMLATASGDT